MTKLLGINFILRIGITKAFLEKSQRKNPNFPTLYLLHSQYIAIGEGKYNQKLKLFPPNGTNQ
jgi:hypothetical protein